MSIDINNPLEWNEIDRKMYQEDSSMKLDEDYIRKDKYVIDSVMSAPTTMKNKIKEFDNKHPEVGSLIFLVGVGALSAILFYNLIANAVCAGEIRAFRKLYKIVK